MGVWSQIAEYLYIKKKDPNRPKSKWIGYMHGINRISLLIFILCLVILAIKLLRNLSRELSRRLRKANAMISQLED